MCSALTVVPGDSAQWQEADTHFFNCQKYTQETHDRVYSSPTGRAGRLITRPFSHGFCRRSLSCHVAPSHLKLLRKDGTEQAHIYEDGVGHHVTTLGDALHANMTLVAWQPDGPRSDPPPFELNKAPLYSLLFLIALLYKTLNRTS